jgi:hypothetical protein
MGLAQDIVTQSILGGSGGHIIENEGVELSPAPVLNFEGAGVDAAKVGEKIVVTIPGGGGGGGEANTGSNVGTGSGVFKEKVGTDLRFKSLKAGAGVTITPSADELLLEATGGVGYPITLTSTQPISVSTGTYKEIALTTKIPALKIGDVVEFALSAPIDAYVASLAPLFDALSVVTAEDSFGDYCKFTEVGDTSPNLNQRAVSLPAFQPITLAFPSTVNPSGMTHFSNFSSPLQNVVRKATGLSPGNPLDLSQSLGWTPVKLTKVRRAVVTFISPDELTLRIEPFGASPEVPDDTYSAVSIFRTQTLDLFSDIRHLKELGFDAIVDSTSIVGDPLRIGNASVVTVTNPSLTQIHGFEASEISKILIFHNRTGGIVDLLHDTGAKQECRITIPGGNSSQSVQNETMVMLAYSPTTQRWVLFSGLTGPEGPQGPQGPQGAQGPMGQSTESETLHDVISSRITWQGGTAPSDFISGSARYYSIGSLRFVYIEASYGTPGSGNTGVNVDLGGINFPATPQIILGQCVSIESGPTYQVGHAHATPSPVGVFGGSRNAIGFAMSFVYQVVV